MAKSFKQLAAKPEPPKRMPSQYEYTQKQALHEALDKLFEGVAIGVRPAHIRQQEESRKQKIRCGIAK